MDRFDHNFARSLAIFASASKTGEVTESRDLLLTTTRSPIAEFNQGLFKTPTYKVQRSLDRVAQYQQRVGVALRLHLASEHEALAPSLIERGYVAVDPAPVMTLDPIGDLPREAEGLRSRRVDDAASLSDFGLTGFESFGFPIAAAPIAITDDFLCMPDVELFVGYVDDAPACCSMLLVTGDVAGIYWVGTRAAHRRRGLGGAITAHAVLAGRARGCRIANLQASAMGAPVYKRMGFETIRHYLRFDVPVSLNAPAR